MREELESGSKIVIKKGGRETWRGKVYVGGMERGGGSRSEGGR